MIIATILVLILPVLLSVAMFTLAERTVMASMQRRYLYFRRLFPGFGSYGY